MKNGKLMMLNRFSNPIIIENKHPLEYIICFSILSICTKYAIPHGYISIHLFAYHN